MQPSIKQNVARHTQTHGICPVWPHDYWASLYAWQLHLVARVTFGHDSNFQYILVRYVTTRSLDTKHLKAVRLVTIRSATTYTADTHLHSALRPASFVTVTTSADRKRPSTWHSADDTLRLAALLHGAPVAWCAPSALHGHVDNVAGRAGHAETVAAAVIGERLEVGRSGGAPRAVVQGDSGAGRRQLHRLVRELVVEVASVRLRRHLRLERGLKLARRESREVQEAAAAAVLIYTRTRTRARVKQTTTETTLHRPINVRWLDTEFILLTVIAGTNCTLPNGKQ